MRGWSLWGTAEDLGWWVDRAEGASVVEGGYGLADVKLGLDESGFGPDC